MSYTRYMTVNFGASRTALGTLGYRLYDSSNVASGSRITADIHNLGGGGYGALVTIPDHFSGRITWDDTTTGLTASEEINDVALPAAPSGYGPAAFSGANAVTINVKYLTTNISGATVTVTQGIIVDTKTTDASGNASFSLNNGDYTLAIVKSGYSFTPETISISGVGTLNKTITAVSIPSPSSGSVVTGFLYTKDPGGTIKAGVMTWWQLITAPTNSQASSSRNQVAVRSDSVTGLATHELIKGGKYKVTTADGASYEFTVPADATSPYEVKE